MIMRVELSYHFGLDHEDQMLVEYFDEVQIDLRQRFESVAVRVDPRNFPRFRVGHLHTTKQSTTNRVVASLATCVSNEA